MLILFQINKFFKQVVRYLLDLNLPRYSIRKRLRPAMEFLSRELQRFHGVLFPESFNKLLTEFWSAVAEVSTVNESLHNYIKHKILDLSTELIR